MKRPRRLRLDLLAHAAFASAIVVILGMGWTLYGTASSTKRAAAWSDEAIDSLQAAADVEASFLRAELGHASFVLSSDPRFAAERDKAIEASVAHLGRLLALQSLSARQREQAQQMQAIVAERHSAMRDEKEARDGASAKRVSDLVAEFRGEELRRLVMRRGAQAASFDTSILALAIVSLVALAVLIPGYLGFVTLLREREKAQRRILDMAEDLPAAVYQYRSLAAGGGRYEFFSRSAERLRGVSRADALADPTSVLGTIVDKDRYGLLEALERAGRARVALQHEFRVQDAAGRIRWLRVNANPSSQPDGTLWTGVWEDVTEMKRMADALDKAAKAAAAMDQSRARFAATMNHELRTPLSSVLGSLELLVRARLEDEQRAAAYLAFESAKSALAVVEDIADFARIEAGTVSLNPGPVSVKEVVESVAQSLDAAARENGIKLATHCDARIAPALMADRQRLVQILNNFAATAAGMGRGGGMELRADLAQPGDEEEIVKLSVRRTDVPESSSAVAKIGSIEPFVQVSAVATRRYEGSGLGLAMCERLAALMGGTIEVGSNPGSGSHWVLILPMPVSDPKQPTQGAEEQPAVQPLEGRRAPPGVPQAREEGTLILIVDDHPISRLVMLRQVNALGYAAESAADGAEALERWSEGGFSLLLTDCEMPGMDGYDLAKHIRAAEARGSRRVPIIGYTANTLGDLNHRSIDAGMDDFMTKPVAMPQLAEKLGRWLPLPGSPLALAPKIPAPPSVADS